MKQCISFGILAALILVITSTCINYPVVAFEVQKENGSAETFFEDVEKAPPGGLVCMDEVAGMAILMAYRKEDFVMQGISYDQNIYFLFVGKDTYSIFFIHPESGSYCTSKSLIGDVVGKPGQET
jgi:hypothetical protein|tara:strand:+ start:313 stop:687 length:375 start_codon:yes stop_codon:yes gene_type:complete